MPRWLAHAQGRQSSGPFETGRHVRKIQQALIDEGFPLPLHGADSVYGPETATAVSNFKTSQNIQPNDGAVGPKTMAALDAIFADEAPFPTPTIGRGEMSLDDFIEALQAAEPANSADTVGSSSPGFASSTIPGRIRTA